MLLTNYNALFGSFLAIAYLLPLDVQAGRVALSFQATVNNKPLILDSIRYKNQVGQPYSISRLSLFLSEFCFHHSDGSLFHCEDSVGWFDSGKQNNNLILKNIPEGNYSKFSFNVGLKPKWNRADPWAFGAQHPLNPNVSSLYWNWKGGYIFAAIEGLYRRKNQKEYLGFSYHFANEQNLTPISISCEIPVYEQTGITIDLAIDKLFHAEGSIDFVNTGSSSHSKQQDIVAEILKNNFRNAFSIHAEKEPVVQKTSHLLKKPLYLPDIFEPFDFRMSKRFPVPNLPADNPLIRSRVELGKKLFNDKNLSADNTISCSSCHKRKSAFSDNARFSMGVNHRVGNRQSMPLFNLAWKKRFFWDGRASSLRKQVLEPIQNHREMDMDLGKLINRLRSNHLITAQFFESFGSNEITEEKISLALESFLLSITSYNSKFDQFLSGKAILTPDEQRGFELFFTENEPRNGQFGADCFHCHGGPLFTDHAFHNNGLESKINDVGLAGTTGFPSDRGKFATPSLRNVALTAPYMHDGRFDTLDSVIDHYSFGVQRSATLDPNLAKHPNGGIALSARDRSDLVAFLKTLTDPLFVDSEENN